MIEEGLNEGRQIVARNGGVSRPRTLHIVSSSSAPQYHVSVLGQSTIVGLDEPRPKI